MRDPKRIPVMLELVREIWERYPDWRLAQVIVNVSDSVAPFYIEDDVLQREMQEWVTTSRAWDAPNASDED